MALCASQKEALQSWALLKALKGWQNTSSIILPDHPLTQAATKEKLPFRTTVMDSTSQQWLLSCHCIRNVFSVIKRLYYTSN